MAVTGDGSLRASHADREAVADRLRVAVDEGRLDIAEYDERVRAAYAAVTYRDLEGLTADLPTPAKNNSAPAVRPSDRSDSRLQPWRGWVGAAVIMLTIWAVTSLASGELVPFWPAMPLGIWAAILIAKAIGGGSGACSQGKTDG